MCDKTSYEKVKSKPALAIPAYVIGSDVSSSDSASSMDNLHILLLMSNSCESPM
jgi:hypothetical protein